MPICFVKFTIFLKQGFLGLKTLLFHFSCLLLVNPFLEYEAIYSFMPIFLVKFTIFLKQGFLGLMRLLFHFSCLFLMVRFSLIVPLVWFISMFRTWTRRNKIGNLDLSFLHNLFYFINDKYYLIDSSFAPLCIILRFQHIKLWMRWF